MVLLSKQIGNSRYKTKKKIFKIQMDIVKLKGTVAKAKKIHWIGLIEEENVSKLQDRSIKVI